MTGTITRTAAGATVAMLIGLLLLGSGCSAEKEAESAARRIRDASSQATAVTIATVGQEPERTRLEAVGTSHARQSVTLFPAASDKVVAVNFEAGQQVSEGDVLLELDARAEELAVELARVRLADAERTLNRYLRSQDSGAVTTSTVDTARTAVQTARIEVDQAQVLLDEHVLKAPFAGFIGITDIDPGDRVDTDTAIATLDDRSVLLVSFEVPELLLGELETGQMIAVGTWARGNAQAQGRIVHIGSRIDPESRTFIVRAHVDNSDDRLRPGMSFRVTLELEGENFPVVPEISLQWGGEGSYAWQVIDGKAQRVAVTIVQRRDGNVLVDGKLNQGALVIVEGVQRMREGLAVSYDDGAELAREDDGTNEVEINALPVAGDRS